MNKRSQSLLDFINVFPLQAIVLRRSPLASKEAKTLFEIWKGDRNGDGQFVLGETVDPLLVASLTSKGLISNKPSHVAVGSTPVRKVEITKKGKEIIRNIILFSEKSSFDQADADFDYDFIHEALNSAPKMAHDEKIASLLEPHSSTWWQRAWK